MPSHNLASPRPAALSAALCVALLLFACGEEPASTGGATDTGLDAGSDTSPDTSADSAAPGDTSGGDAVVPDSVAPDAVAPDSAAPDSAASDAAAQDAGPDTAAQDASPDATSPDTTSPDATSPDATIPDTSDASDSQGSGAWALPSCATPTGGPGIAFGPKLGQQLHISSAPLNPGKTYTMGLAATGVPGLLYAEHAGTVYRSTNGGCAWASVGTLGTTPARMVPTQAARVYAFSDNGAGLWRVEGTTVTALSSPSNNILGVSATSADGLRLGGKDGQLWDNASAGSGLWKKVGKAPNPGGLGYRVAISPLDPDRALYGVKQKGFWRTDDGGKTWSLATFQGAVGPQKVNGMNAVFSPVVEDVVWAMAIDLNESLQRPSKTNGKYLWRSTDGGKTFVKAVGHLEQNDVTLTNGVHLIPDAVDAKVVRWAFGTCYSGYGTNLYRYDAGADKLSWVNHPVPGMSELIHHPADPTLLVIGLRGDNNPQCP